MKKTVCFLLLTTAAVALSSTAAFDFPPVEPERSFKYSEQWNGEDGYDSTAMVSLTAGKALVKKEDGYSAKLELTLDTEEACLTHEVSGDWSESCREETWTYRGADEATRFFFDTDAGFVKDVEVVEGQDCLSPVFSGESCEQIVVSFEEDEDYGKVVHTYSVVPNEDGTVVIEHIKEEMRIGDPVYESEITFMLTFYENGPIDDSAFRRFCDPTLFELPEVALGVAVSLSSTAAFDFPPVEPERTFQYSENRNGEDWYDYTAMVSLTAGKALVKQEDGHYTQLELTLEDESAVLTHEVAEDWLDHCREISSNLRHAEKATRFFFDSSVGFVKDVEVAEGRECLSPVFSGEKSCEQIVLSFEEDDRYGRVVHTYSVVPNEDGTVVIEHIKEVVHSGEPDRESVRTYTLTSYENGPIDASAFRRFCEPTMVELPELFQS